MVIQLLVLPFHTKRFNGDGDKKEQDDYCWSNEIKGVQNTRRLTISQRFGLVAQGTPFERERIEGEPLSVRVRRGEEKREPR